MARNVALRPDGERDLAGFAKASTAAEMHPVIIHLVKTDKLGFEEARRITDLARNRRQPLPELLREQDLLSPELWVSTLSQDLGIELVDRTNFPQAPILPDRLSGRFLKRSMAVPLAVDGDHVWLAMADPFDRGVINAVELATRLTVVPCVASIDELRAAHGRIYEGGQAALDRIVADLGMEIDPADFADDDPEHAAETAPVIRLVNQLLIDALRLHASDIHLEPFADRLRVRYRVHGRLKEMPAPPARLAPAIVSRIKILAKLDIAERRLPQDGRVRVEIEGRQIDLRVATAPTMNGESLVVRVLDGTAAGVQLGELGLGEVLEARLKTLFASPHGQFLVTGPTGSGKTTTLYAGLRELNDDTRKIVSIEDPVEYQINGVTQIQVRPEIGLDFARILRSIVRHDPDVILVGETRDTETAEISIHAALTGHLLLSTLHTNSAAGAVARLLEMGVEPYLLASVLRGVLGQRLVGVLCGACKGSRPLRPEEEAVFATAGIDCPSAALVSYPVGCPHCNEMGVTGRIGIFEYLEVTERVRALIRSRAPTQDILDVAMQDGMVTMFKDGLFKVLAGITTLEEVARVTEDW